MRQALRALPWKAPPFWKAKHSDALWFFIGQNLGQKPMRGRLEHTDQVMHSGTWHLQLSGSKTWYIRPHLDSWSAKPPLLSGEKGADGHVRLRVHCEPGDLLFVNTRLWWHETAIDSTRMANGKVSLTCARDFYLGAQNPDCDMTNVDGLFATRAVKKGAVVVWENEMPNCALPRSKTPNCFVSYEGLQGALVALKDLEAGDWLTVYPSDDEDGENKSPSPQLAARNSRRSRQRSMPLCNPSSPSVFALEPPEPQGKCVALFFPSAFALACFMLALMGLKKPCSFQKPMRQLQDPLLHT